MLQGKERFLLHQIYRGLSFLKEYLRGAKGVSFYHAVLFFQTLRSPLIILYDYVFYSATGGKDLLVDGLKRICQFLVGGSVDSGAFCTFKTDPQGKLRICTTIKYSQISPLFQWLYSKGCSNSRTSHWHIR